MSQSENRQNSKRPTRWLFSQIIAAFPQNFTLLDLGMAMSFSTILIPALLGAEGELSFTKEQASWFGSINFILQPVGGVLSGPICERLGRKRSLLVSNLPHMAAWLMIYFAQDIATLFCANAILGLGLGLMDAPILTYVGEISHPSVRGFMTAYIEVYAVCGVFLSYLLGTVMPWRQAAIVCLIFPLATLLSATWIPESPVWLLTKGRKDDALKALCWIRGWCQPSEVQKEFDDLLVYQEVSAQCSRCIADSLTESPVTSVECPHKNLGWIQKIKYNWKDLTRKEIVRPLNVALLLFFIQQTTGVTAIRPNMVNVYNTFGMGVDGHLATVATGFAGIIGILILMFTVKWAGKRFLVLMSLIVSTICTFFLGTYAYSTLPHDVSSYSPVTIAPGSASWLPIILFIVLNVTFIAGVGIIPWMMVSEIFPLRGRGMACGVAAAFSYIMNFAGSKLYYDIETALGLYGAMWLFSAFSFGGLLFSYYLVPETEGKPFEEIEKDFSGKQVPIFATDAISRRIFKDRCVDSAVSSNTAVNVSTIEKQIGVYRSTADNEKSKL